jgi:hypothetical protein
LRDGALHGGAALTPAREARVARWTIGVTACFDAAILSWFASRDAHLPAIATIACFLAAASLFFDFARRERLISGLLALLILIGLSEAARMLGPNSAQHNTYASGAVLLGYLAGAAFARRLPATDEEPFSVAAARGALAALYVSSGISKLRASGFGWLSAAPVQSTLAVLSPIEGWRGGLAHWLIEQPALCAGIAIATVVIELGAFLLLARGRIRPLWAALLIAMHATIALLTPVVYERNVILLAVFGIVLSGRRERDERRVVEPKLVARFAVIASACVAVVFIATAAMRGRPSREIATTHTPAPCRERQIGSLVAGASIAGWKIFAIERTDCCAFLHLARGAEEVVFVIQAAGGETRRSPFDRGDLSISYRSTPVPYEHFRAAGDALAATFSDASGLRRWLARPCT